MKPKACSQSNSFPYRDDFLGLRLHPSFSFSVDEARQTKGNYETQSLFYVVGRFTATATKKVTETDHDNSHPGERTGRLPLGVIVTTIGVEGNDLQNKKAFFRRKYFYDSQVPKALTEVGESIVFLHAIAFGVGEVVVFRRCF